jgi:hypothetical protein
MVTVAVAAAVLQAMAPAVVIMGGENWGGWIEGGDGGTHFEMGRYAGVDLVSTRPIDETRSRSCPQHREKVDPGLLCPAADSKSDLVNRNSEAQDSRGKISMP